MNEQNTQGDCLERRRSPPMGRHELEDPPVDSQQIPDHQSLLSSPRHSELSLISDSTGLKDSDNFGGTGLSKEVRDPNFIQIRDHRDTLKNQNNQKGPWQNDIFAPSNEAKIMYQTQQQQLADPGPLGKTLGSQAMADRLSQIMARQSYPQAPITDRKRESMQNRDSMEGARQGLQGAGNGGSIVHGAPYQLQNQRVQTGTVTNSVTNDRLSSVQFMLSQSDKDGPLISSQHNYINVTEAFGDQQENGRLPLHLQWSLTQSGGLDSLETESIAKQTNILQSFHSPLSVAPTIKSEDYTSQFNSVKVQQLAADTANKHHQQMQYGEQRSHQRPIVINSMTPMAADSTPSSIQLIPERQSEENSFQDNRPSQEQQQQDLYDNILSSPSELVDRSVADHDTSVTQYSRKMPANLTQLEPIHEQVLSSMAVLSPAKVIMKSPENSDNCPSSLRVKRKRSPEPDSKNHPIEEVKITVHESECQEGQEDDIRSSQYLTTVLSPIVAVNLVEPVQIQKQQFSAGKPPCISKSQSSRNHNSARGNQECASDDGSSESDDEEEVAMISVRGGNPYTITQSDLLNEGSASKEDLEQDFKQFVNRSRSESPQICESNRQEKEQQSVDNLPVSLPLPHELFNDNRPSEFEQPILSAKIELPKQIFSQEHYEDHEKDEGDTSEFKLEALESQARLANSRDTTPRIDYGNLPIEVSNLLLKQATSFLKQESAEAVQNQAESGDREDILESSSPKRDTPHAHQVELHPEFQPKSQQQLLILTDQNLDFGSSKGYEEDSYEVQSNMADRQAEMRPEDLERNPCPAEQSSSISISQLKLESEQLVQVSEMTKNELLMAAQRDFRTDSKTTNNAFSKGEEISYLISRQTSMESDDQSVSLMFSQTNKDDRMTLLSMGGLTQEKSYPSGQPTTSRKHHQRAQQFPQTSEKKGLGLDHVPSTSFAASQINGDRRQSCTSFNNTTLRERTSCASRQSYFVNALGQRISSDVLLGQHPVDTSLQNLVGNSHMWPVQEFGGETMSTIPDEALAQSNRQLANHEDVHTTSMLEDEAIQNQLLGRHQQLMRDRAELNDQQIIQIPNKDVSAPGCLSTTKQSVTEINFHSFQESANLQQAPYPQQIVESNERGGRNLEGYRDQKVRQMTDNCVADSAEDDKMSIKRNLNLLTAFKTTQEGMPQQIHMQNSSDSLDQNSHHQHVLQLQQQESSKQSSSQNQTSPQQPPQCMSYPDEHQPAGMVSHLLDESNEADLVVSNRALQFREDLPIFKSHENMGRVNGSQYSLEAQQNFYQRYKHIKTGEMQGQLQQELVQPQATAPHHIKSNSVQLNHPVVEDQPAIQSSSFQRGRVQDSQKLSAYRKVNLIRSDGGRSTPENEGDSYLEGEPVDVTQERHEDYAEHHVTQEYFAEENPNHVTNNECIEDYLTDDDIAVFKSQLNDIPADLACQPIKINLSTNVRLLQQRHQTSFLMSIEEADPIRVLMATSNSKKKSRAVSISTQQATEDDNTGAGIEDRLSPKFEKLLNLKTHPSRQEHVKSSKASMSVARTPLMIRTVDPSNDEGIQSSPLVSNPTTKSFLHRIATQKGFQERLEDSDKSHITPTSTTHQQQLPITIYPHQESHSPTGVLSEDDNSMLMDGEPRVQDIDIAVPRDCMTTTNQDAMKKRPSLMSAIYRHQGSFANAANQTQDARDQGQKKRKSGMKQSKTTKRKTSPIITTQQMQLRSTQMTGISRGNESVPRDLQQWLSSLSLSQYGPLLVEQGLDDLQSLILMMGQDRVLPLTHEILMEAGIESSGHRARILVNLELEAGAFEQNQEVIDLLQTSTMQKEQVMQQADQIFFAGGNSDSSPAGHHNMSQGRSEQHRQTPEHERQQRYGGVTSPMSHSPLTEQFKKGRADRSPLRPQAPSNKLAGSYFSLSNWLGKNNLLFLQPVFVRSGYECLRSLILQSFSQFNKLTDETLKNQIGIDKIGHRLRILSQLRQDALILFQMELIYRQAKETTKASTLSHDESLFVLPGRQQHYFKSVFNDSASGASKAHNSSLLQAGQPQHTQSQQYFHHHIPHQQHPAQSSHAIQINEAPHHHMSQQQPQSKKMRTKNYSFSKEAHSESVPSSLPSSQQTSYRQYQQQVPSSQTNQGRQRMGLQTNNNHGASAYSFIKDHVESNLNHPWRHSTYFDQSRPVASQTSQYGAGQGGSSQSQASGNKMPFQREQKNENSMIVSRDSEQRAQLLQEYQRSLRETLDQKQINATKQAQQVSPTNQTNGTTMTQNRRANLMQQNVLNNDDKSCNIF